MRRRAAVSALAVAAIAAPAGFAVAQETADNPKPGVPASECPEAAAAVERDGGPPVDRFVPDCPTPEQVDRELGKPGWDYPVPKEEVIETCEENPEVARGNGLCRELGAGQ